MAIQQLRSRIWSLRVQNCDGRHFVPQGEVNQIFTPDNVYAALKESGAELHDLATSRDVVLRRAQRVFAILITIYEAKAILTFIANEQLQGNGLDLSLPYRKAALDFLPLETAERFYEAQWEFAAPVLSHHFQHRYLDSLIVMPFTTSQFIGRGSSGIVYELEVHPQHHEIHHLCKDGRLKVVRKEIQSLSNLSIDNEHRVLSILNSVRHPNILELLGSYTLQEKHNFIFPLASRPLAAYLSSDDQLLGFPDLASVIAALPGLVSAVRTLHSCHSIDVALIGCHRDIKPENILVMDRKFVLADFGLSTLKDPAKGSDSYFRLGGGFYLPPECEDWDDNFKKRRIGRASDIWSLGCVLAELLVFLASGPDEVARFRQERRVTFGGFFTTSTFHHGQVPNLAVERRLASLKAVAYDEAMKKLIVLTGDMLNIDPQRRPKAAEVLRRFRSLALEHICGLVLADFDGIDNASLPFDLNLEKERFRSWNSAFRALTDPTVGTVPPVLERDLVYGGIIQLLQRTREALGFLQHNYYNIHFIVSKLQQINDELGRELDEPAAAMMMKDLELRVLNYDTSDSVYQNANHLEDTPAYQRLGILAALKHMHNLSQVPSHYTNEKWKVDRYCLYDQNRSKSQNFQLARFSSGNKGVESVLIQRMVYDAKWAGELGELLFARMEAIIEFLRASSEIPSFHVLPCIGYYHEAPHHAFGLIFGFPERGVKEKLQPTSLHQLIQETKNVHLRPELGQLFRLAHSIASCLLEYHTIHWLHKSISADHIIFFSTRQDQSACDVSEPYVIGFNHSRQDKPNEYSEGPENEKSRMKYQHPLYQSGKFRYCPAFDYFSLGLLLVEIGLWKPLDSTAAMIKTPTDNYRSYIARIRKEVMPVLGSRMGQIYRDATLACLTFNVENTATANADTDARSVSCFKEVVIDSLKRCSV